MSFDLYQGPKKRKKTTLWKAALLNPESPQSDPETLQEYTDVALLRKDITQLGWTDQTTAILSKYDMMCLSARWGRA